ncbi:EAL domain-containing protein [uncultured Thiodictyon sp.]|uniref:EAL domain-containing protein n=1 Tax=uncultured Thiodictyon sp. TaxID=1846217 RepID=UPI0025F6ECB2|nr:EAL domain-containing protein [uncultured Thiodictyon sp.]
MPDASRPSDPLVCFFGSDLRLWDRLHDRLAEHLIKLRNTDSMSGLMAAVGARGATVLIMELDSLPPGSTAASILDRLERDTGSRPELVCLVGQAIEHRGETCPEAVATFQAPFDASRIVARVLDSVAARTVRLRRVLIVDGLPQEGDEFQAILRGAGLSADQMADPQRVIRVLEQSATDLVLLDLNLPGGASRRVTDAIRRHAILYNLPILFLSAETSPEHQGEVLDLGGDKYLARPVSAEQLLAAVRGRFAESGAVAPTAGPPAAASAAASPLLSQTQLVKRLDHAVINDPAPAIGQAVLFIRPDDSVLVATLDAVGLDQLLRLVFELVCRQAATRLHAAALCEDGCYAWVHCGSDAEIIELADAIRMGAASLALPARLGRLSFSIGVGFFAPPLDNALTLISRAEAAAEQAHNAGGNRVYRHREPRRPGVVANARVLGLLQQALNGSGFQLVYQPIVSLRTSIHERYEVLLRLRTPHGEIMPPSTFLPVAADHGLLPALDRWVLAGALATLHAERATGRRTRLMIHQTVVSLAEPGWLKWLRDEILRLNLIRQRPVLEFNARDILADEGHARLLFPELARLGIDICLAGVTDSKADLDLLTRLRIAFAKLARELVDRESGARLNGLVGRVHKYGPQVIAAGIEDPEAIGRVWSSGVDFIQGNFIQFPEESLNFQFHQEAVAVG